MPCKQKTNDILGNFTQQLLAVPIKKTTCFW